MTDDYAREGAIALIGMAGRFPGADTLDSFWRNLQDGVCSIRFLEPDELRAAGVPESTIQHPQYVPALGLREDLELFDPQFFGITPREAEIMDPQHRLLLLCAWEALENAGYDPRGYDGAIGVYAGAMANTYLDRNLLPNAAELKHVLRRQMIMNNDREFMSTFISFKLDLRGPSVNVQTACSTSLVAVHFACQALLNGECDMALAGGVALTVPAKRGYFFREGMIQSPDGRCRAFDARAQGTVFGRGAGMLLLRRLEGALQNRDVIHAVVRGTAINNDGGRKLSFSAPSVDGQAEAIAAAMAVGGVEPDQIGYLEAHGTGTILGDPVEIASLTRAFAGAAAASCAIGSVKTNIGHLDAAAGAAGLIKAVLCLKHRTLVPSLFFETPNPHIDFENSPFRVNTTTRPWPSEGPRFAGINSFGVGGTNAHVVLEEAPPVSSDLQREPVPLLVSARSPEVLARQCALLADHLEAQPDLNLADMAYTLALGRRPLPTRFAALCADRASAIAALRRATPGPDVRATPRLLGLLPGQGATLARFGQALFARQGAFADALRRCHNVADREGFDLHGLLYPSQPTDADLNGTEIAQPLGFAIGLALGLQFQAWGCPFAGFLGHSLGELTAATLAGVFTLEDGMRLALARGRLMAACPPGAMLAVAATRQRLAPLLAPGLEIAAENAPERLTLAGPVPLVEALTQRLAAAGIASQRLAVAHAFHTGDVDQAAAQFRAIVAETPRCAPHIPFLSGVTGDWVLPDQACDSDYWARSMREPVRFGAALQRAAASQIGLLLELGPDGGLTRFAKHLQGLTAIAAWSGGDAIAEPVPAGLTRLWQAGLAIDWTKFFAWQRRARVALPSQPFLLTRHWVEAPKPLAQKPKSSPESKSSPASMRRHDDIGQWFYVPEWRERSVPTVDQDCRRWLVFAPRGQQGERLIAGLRPKVAELLVIQPAPAYAMHDGLFSIRPDQPDDWTRVLAALDTSAHRPTVVVHAWSLDPAAALGQAFLPDDLATQLELRFYSLFHFLQQAATGGTSLRDWRFLILGQHTQVVAEGEWAHPLGAVSYGAIRVLAQEFPGAGFRHLDLDGAADLAIDSLLAETQDGVETYHVALRGARRLVGEHRAQNFASASPQTHLRAGGTYLITGGLGGINLEIAAYLARQTGGTLVLTSRRAFPAPERWAALFEGELESDLRHQLDKLRAIQSYGARVHVVRADSGDREAMTRLFAWMRAQFGGPHGIVNGAGIVDGGMIYHRDRASIEAVFRPKLHGSLILADLMRAFKVDFAVHFGTLHRAVGGVGKLAHCAASAVLDAVALALPGRQLAIDWDAWLEVGQAAKPELEERRHLDHPLFSALIRQGERRMYALTLAPARDWLLSEHRIGGQPTLPGTGYLALIREALALEGQPRVELADILILEPLTVADDGASTLRVVLDGGPERGEGQVTSGVDATCHVSFRWAVLADGHDQQELGNLAAVLPHYREPSGKRRADDFYVHGPRWHSLAWMRWSAHESVASLALDEAFSTDCQTFALHPALLDTALGLLARTHHKGTYLPFAFASVRLHAPLPPRFMVQARLHQGTSTETLVQDLDLRDDQGNLLVAIRGFALREEPARSRRAPTATFQVTVTPGDLASLGFREFERTEPAPGHVEIEVSAAALNFKDVLKATGMMGRGASARQLGMEVCGRVSQVGQCVSGLEPGQRVVALTKHGLQTHVQVEADLVFPCPDGLDDRQAASVIVAYLTAYQALIQVGRMRVGERLLIHCATGGVGLAALNLALRHGAQVHATAGSATKRAYLAKFPLASIHDSRDQAYIEAIRAQTSAQGLDLVLNSLSGEAIRQGLDLLAPFGRFLELGRRDIEEGTALSLAHFAKHVSFAAITASPAMPGFRDSMATLLDSLATGALPPLPLTSFPIERVADGFALLAQAGHIGKVVVDFSSRKRVRPGRASLSAPPRPKGHGMRNAEGVEVFARLLAHDCRHVVVSTRLLAGVAARQDRRLQGETAPQGGAGEPGSTVQILCAIWSQFLGMDQVAPDANFFELGGDSLTAIQIVAQINRRFGAALSSYALLDDPTIKALARRLGADAPAAAPQSRLIALNVGTGDSCELFVFPPMEGDLFGYRQLAQRLPDYAVWGVHEASQAGQAPSAASLEELATRHLELILAHRPKGPYFLAGYSFGGLLALESGRQLRARGEQVAVALIDSYGPSQLTFAFKDDAEVLAFLLAGAEPLPQLASRLAQLDEQGRAEAFAAVRGQSMEPSALSAMLAVFRANAELMRAYRPGPLDAPVLHLAAADRLPGFPQDVPAFWRAHCGADFREVVVSGTHRTVLVSSDLADALRHFFCPP